MGRKLTVSSQHVVVNYRLTIFGFARLSNLKEDKSLNVGMRDQRAAFQWVQNNIAAFGGDLARVTAFGLSSGGTFASLHLMTYGGEKGVPFTQGWAMSGPPGTALNITSDACEIHTRAVAQLLDCPEGSDKDILQCLRDAPMEKLLEVAVAYSSQNHPPMGLFTFIPSIDSDLSPSVSLSCTNKVDSSKACHSFSAGRTTTGPPMQDLHLLSKWKRT